MRSGSVRSFPSASRLAMSSSAIGPHVMPSSSVRCACAASTSGTTTPTWNNGPRTVISSRFPSPGRWSEHELLRQLLGGRIDQLDVEAQFVAVVHPLQGGHVTLTPGDRERAPVRRERARVFGDRIAPDAEVVEVGVLVAHPDRAGHLLHELDVRLLA